MTIQINADGRQIPVRHIEFSDGCSNLVIDWPEDFVPEQYVNISVDPSTPGDKVLFEILLAVDAVSRTVRSAGVTIGLHLPYLPHARADRVFEKGNPLPLEAFCYSLRDGRDQAFFDTVYLTDPHSLAAIKIVKEAADKVVVKNQFDCFKDTNVPVDEVTLLVGPDEGSREKLKDFPSVLVTYASKVRDVATGRITSTTVPDQDLTGIRCIIVDDIADGGGTFIPLAKALREKGCTEVELYVTHGIFAKGLESFRGVIDKIHVYQIVQNYITRDDLKTFNSTEYQAQ